MNIRGNGRWAALLLAVLLLVPSVSTAVNPSQSGGTDPAPAPEHGSTQAAPASASAAPVPASPGLALQGALATSGDHPGKVPDLPEPAAERPLAKALAELARHRDVDPQALERAQAQADRLPYDLQRSLALLVLAQVEAQAGTTPGDRAANAEQALLLGAAADAAVPTLRRYAQLQGTGAHEVPAQQARTVDLVVALATGARPLAEPGSDGDLSSAVMDLYRVLGVEPTPKDAQLLDAGESALPGDARRAATVLVEARTRAAQLQVEALSELTPRERALLLTLEGPGSFGGAPTEDRLATQQAYLDALSKVDHGKLAEADLLLATAALQSRAILDGQDEAEAGGLLSTVWTRVKDLVSRLVPVGTARAQAGQGGCPNESPLSDCGNDVWFTDPFGIVVVSGPQSTTYDDRYGRVSLSERTGSTLERLPTDDENVSSRTVLPGTSTGVEGSAGREAAENATSTPTVSGADEALLQRPWYAATLDMGGDDTYIHHTATTLDLTPLLAAATRGSSSDPTVQEIGGSLVGDLGLLPGAVEDRAVPVPSANELGEQVPFLASVLVDVQGDDRYVPGTERSRHGTIASASTLGVAVLLDASGEDTYDGGDHSVGAASTLGRAFLLDLDGDDTLRAGNVSLGAARIFSTALVLGDCADDGSGCPRGDDAYRSRNASQGWGSLGGVGVLLDRGGTDTYDLRGATGQGYGTLLGTGLLADVGGTDDRGIRGTAGTPVGPGDLQVVTGVNHERVAGHVWMRNTQRGVGTGNASAPAPGAGVALDLDHPAALDLDDDTGPVASVQEVSLGSVDLPGLFTVDLLSDTRYTEPYLVLVDLGGWDTYENGAASPEPGEAALLLDLRGNDRYGEPGTHASDRQASTRGGVALLADLGRTTDTYQAGDRAQAHAADGGVAFLLDDGTEGDADTFTAGGHSQGAATTGGLAALVTLQGATTYRAAGHAQGFGASGGTGLLVDRHNPEYARAVDRGVNPSLSYAPHDTYEAEHHAQGAALGSGSGILLDSWGDDGYRLSTDRGQGYAAPAADAPNGTLPTRGILADLHGKDRYDAQGRRVHGFAAGSRDDTDTMNATRAFLLDLHLPDVPLPTAQSLTGGVNQTNVGNLDPALFPSYDISEHYDEWLREGQGDTYAPATTSTGQEKRENSYWMQPRSDAGASNTTEPGNASAHDGDPARLGLGMDNPPLAAYGLTFDAFARNVTGTGLGPLLVRTVVPILTPNVNTTVHTAAEGGCGAPADHLTGKVCVRSNITYQGASGDPDRHADVRVYLKPQDPNMLRGEEVDRFLVARADTRSLYDAAKRASQEGASGTGVEMPPCSQVPGSEALPGGPYSEIFQHGNVRVCWSNGTPQADAPTTVEVTLHTERTCEDVNWTLPTCPRSPGAVPDAAAFPGGPYRVIVEVRNAGTTLTSGHAVGQGSATFGLASVPQLLDVRVDHPNPHQGHGGAFTLVTTAPTRGYQVDVTTQGGERLERLHAFRWTGSFGEPRTLFHERGGDTVNRTVYETRVPWDARDEDGSFLAPGAYRFDAAVNTELDPFTSFHRLTLSETDTGKVTGGEVDTLDLTLPTRRSGTAVAHWESAKQLYVVGGVNGTTGQVTPEVLRYDLSTNPPKRTHLDVDWNGHGPLTGATAWWDNTEKRILLFGGRTPSGTYNDGVLALDPSVDEGRPTVVDVTSMVDAAHRGNLAPRAHAALAYNGSSTTQFYLVGGEGPDGLRKDVVLVDMAKTPVTVRKVGKLPVGLSHAAAAPTSNVDNEDVLLVAGGRTKDGATAALFTLRRDVAPDPSRTLQKASTSLATPLSDAAGFPLDGGIRLLGGVQGDGTPSSAVYDVTLGSEEPAEPLPAEFPRYHDGTRVIATGTDTYLVLGAGRWVPSEPVEDIVASDAVPPSGSFPVTTSAIGCDVVDCSAPDADGNRTLRVPVHLTDDASGIESVERSITRNGASTSLEPLRPGGATRVNATVPVREVSHGDVFAVTVRATDGAGNTGPEVTRTYTADLREPRVRTLVDEHAPHPGVQNRTTFPVSWDVLSPDVEQVHLRYRLPGVGGAWRTAAVVPAQGPDAVQRATWNASALGESGNVSHGSLVVLEALAEDDAGNLQRSSASNQRNVTLDLLGPVVEDLRATVDRTAATVTWDVTGEASLHTLHIEGPQGELPLRTLEGDHDTVTFRLEELRANTTYDLTARSVDIAGHVDEARTSFTTNTSLTASLLQPADDALLHGTVPVRFQVGAVPAERGGDPSVTWSLQGGDGEPVLGPRELVVSANLTHPAEPGGDAYPPTLDTTRLPDGANRTLTLVVTNDQGTVESRRVVTVDNTGPRLDANRTPVLEGSRGPAEGDVPWFRTPVTLREVPVVDDVTGVERIRYGLDAGELPKVYVPHLPPVFEEEGRTTVHYRAVDGAGNVQPTTANVSFGIDTTPPVLELRHAPGSLATTRNITLNVTAVDGLSGLHGVRVAANASLLDEASWTEPANLTGSVNLTLPAGDGEHVVAAQARDGAGNTVHANLTLTLSTRPPRLVEAPRVIPAGATAVEVSWTTDKPSRSEVLVLRDDGNATWGSGEFATRHDVAVTGLDPGENLTLRVILEDRGGHRVLSPPVNASTPPDRTPPASPANLTARDTGQGAVVLTWLPARDDTGVERYVVERRDPGGGFHVVGNASGTRFRDTGAPAGVELAYRVTAVDHAGNHGPASLLAEAVATTPPSLTDATAELRGSPPRNVTFAVTLTDPDGDQPVNVRALVNGDPVTLHKVRGDVKEGARYEAVVNLTRTSLPLDEGLTVWFEASDGSTTARAPEDGPVTVAPQGGGAPDEGDGDVRDVPLPLPVSLAALLAAALVLHRRRGGGPGGGPDGGRYRKTL